MSVADILSGVKVEIGFGVDAVGGSFFVLDDVVKGELDNITYLLAPDDVLVDVSAHVAAVKTDRGRERELDEYSTGKATVVFNDDDRTFDGSYSGSPYANEIVPMKRIEITWQGIDLFTGWIHDWSVTYEPGDNLSRVTAECFDGFGILANQQLSEIAPAFSGDLAGARITRVLNRSEVNYPAARAIDTGNTVLGATTLDDNALAYLQACTKAEAGYLFVAADGTLTFLNRLATLNVPSGGVFSDDRSTGIPYRNITQRSAADMLFTRVTGTSETTGNEVEASAPTSTGSDRFFVRTLPLGTLLSLDDTETQNLVDYYLERFSTVEQRFQTAEVNVATLSTAEAQTLLALDLTDVVTVERAPLNVGPVISRQSMVDGIAHRIGHGKWTVDLSFANVDTRAFLMLDDAVFGALDSNRLAF